MKTIKLLMIALLMSLTMLSFGQSTYEKIDSTNKNKVQLYSDTKMFIAEYWKSAQNVIQNDDKEAGMILVKGIFVITQQYNFMYSYELTYAYTVKFMFKDNKYKMIIDNAYCDRAINLGTNQDSPARPHPCLNCEYPGSSSGLFKKRWDELQIRLDAEFKSILTAYSVYIQKPSQVDTW